MSALIHPQWMLLSLLLASLSGCASIARKVTLPGSYLPRTQAVVPASSDYELITLKLPDGTKIAAQFGAARLKTERRDADTPRPLTVIFFYGNRMSIAGSQGIFGDLRSMGVNVLIPDYPGYAMSEGVATERSIYATADAALDYLLRRADADPQRIVVAGMSLGAAVAVELAHKTSAEDSR
jgi:pimeloyl-ACP methyl ester carboxylesterase